MRMNAKRVQKGRLEAFSDGVIAVIITILVLELKVPALDGVPGLVAVLPTVCLYLLTFVQIGIYWINHHYLVDDTQSVTHGMLWSNLMFLFCLSLFPFAIEWIGAKGLSSFSAALYAAVSIFPGLGYMALWWQIRLIRGVSPDISWGKQVASISALSLSNSRGVAAPGPLACSHRDRGLVVDAATAVCPRRQIPRCVLARVGLTARSISREGASISGKKTPCQD